MMINYNQNYQSILILILFQNNSIEISENFSLGKRCFFHQKIGKKHSKKVSLREKQQLHTRSLRTNLCFFIASVFQCLLLSQEPFLEKSSPAWPPSAAKLVTNIMNCMRRRLFLGKNKNEKQNFVMSSKKIFASRKIVAF